MIQTVRKPRVSREQVMSALTDALRPLKYVHSLWEGGAPGYGRLDEWSDIDAYILVDGDKVEETFEVVERTFKDLSGIKQKYDVGVTQWPGVYQAFYRLEDASEYMIIDLAVLTIGCQETFLEPEVHGRAQFRFNKKGAARPSEFDEKTFEKRMRSRLERLKARNEMFGVFVQKEINRRNWMEAVGLYRLVVLDSLLEALRMKHNPAHFDFKTRYVHQELPQKVVARLEDFYFVADEDDLRKKYGDATKWFRRVVSELERNGVRVRLA